MATENGKPAGDEKSTGQPNDDTVHVQNPYMIADAPTSPDHNAPPTLSTPQAPPPPVHSTQPAPEPAKLSEHEALMKGDQAAFVAAYEDVNKTVTDPKQRAINDERIKHFKEMSPGEFQELAAQYQTQLAEDKKRHPNLSEANLIHLETTKFINHDQKATYNGKPMNASEALDRYVDQYGALSVNEKNVNNVQTARNNIGMGEGGVEGKEFGQVVSNGNPTHGAEMGNGNFLEQLVGALGLGELGKVVQGMLTQLMGGHDVAHAAAPVGGPADKGHGQGAALVR